MGSPDLKAQLLEVHRSNGKRRSLCVSAVLFLALIVAASCVAKTRSINDYWGRSDDRISNSDVVQSQSAVVAADDGRCSEIGISVLEKHGHAVDAAVAIAACLGVVCPMSSGIGGGGFMVVRNSSNSFAQAIDMRETAPAAASQGMYDDDETAKYSGALSMGVPGEIAGLYVAWLKFGRLPWSSLFQPAIKLAKEGFIVSEFLGSHIESHVEKIRIDPGLRKIYEPDGDLLKAGDVCYNLELGNSLEVIADRGPEAFYNGEIGEKLIGDVRKAGGILTMEDLRDYKVKVTDPVTLNVMGYKILGMPSPSSGTLGLSLVLNVLDSYQSKNGAWGVLGLHRFVEALKHMFALRMNLGDPEFVDITQTASKMLSTSFAETIRKKIFDNTTFPPEYYMPKWSQLQDHGTSHFCVVDGDRNAVSMTTTVNYVFGAGVLSPSTGIVLNNEMDDFSIPTEITPDKLPPAPANFIRPNKRPLSSMTPIIVLKNDQLAGVIGGSGGIKIIPAVAQVFIKHFVLGMDPVAAVESGRVYHKLIPNVVSYENFTVEGDKDIEVPLDQRNFLSERGHKLESTSSGAICQLVVQNLDTTNYVNGVYHGILTAVSDPRKGGSPAAI